MAKKPLIIGLTGSIGMGKSTAAKILRQFGLPVHNADAVVHDLLRRGGAAVKPVAKLFPESLKNGGIDRAILGQSVFNDTSRLRKLEAILHPLVQKSEKKLLQSARAQGLPAIVLEIPLLFETGSDSRCDVTICVSAPAFIQRARVLARPGMTLKKFRAIRALQMSDADKRRRADFIVPTGEGVAVTRKALRLIISELSIISTQRKQH